MVGFLEIKLFQHSSSEMLHFPETSLMIAVILIPHSKNLLIPRPQDDFSFRGADEAADGGTIHGISALDMGLSSQVTRSVMSFPGATLQEGI